MKTQDQLTIEALQKSLADKQRLIERIAEERNKIGDLHPGVGGLYRRQPPNNLIKSELLDGVVHRVDYSDTICFTWSRVARIRWGLSTFSQLEGHTVMSMPSTVRAENWWHLCSQVGVIEPVARVMYYHPENDQESAVAKARPSSRGPRIYCQGDYID